MEEASLSAVSRKYFFSEIWIRETLQSMRQESLLGFHKGQASCPISNQANVLNESDLTSSDVFFSKNIFFRNFKEREWEEK